MPDSLTAPPAEATVGHNSAAVGEMIDADPAIIFREPDLVPALLDEIQKDIEAHVPDLSTETGRGAIASLAFKITKKKTRLDEAGKALNEDRRAAINKVDAVRKTVRDRLDELRDKARAPLTKWEADETARDKRVGDTLRVLNDAARPHAGATSGDLGSALDLVRSVVIDEATFRHRTEEITGVRDRVAATLSAAHTSALRAEQAQDELAQIKADQAAKDRAAADAKAKADAEAETARRDEAERKRQADDVKAAEDRAAAAARDTERKASEEKLAALEAERKAAADALAKKEAEEAEAKRKADAAAAEAKRRESDEENRKLVIKTAVLAMSGQTGTPLKTCRQIVLAIVAGQVPAITIAY